MAHHRAALSLALALVLVLALFPTQTVHAAAFVVNNRGDSVDINPGNGTCADAAGLCTLRAAIMEANARSGADTITVPNGTITLTLQGRDENGALTGDLDITDAVTITGAGGNAASDPSLTVIQAGTDAYNGIDKVFSVNPNFDKAFVTTLQAMTIRYGYNSSMNPDHGYGGGLDWEASGNGKLNITNCIISDNTAVHFDGGGLMTSNSYGPASSVLVTITQTTIANNRTLYGAGGGISMGSNVPFTMTDSIVRNNSASTDSVSDVGQGGGLYFGGASLLSTISGSTFSGNSALGRNLDTTAGAGGGIFAMQGSSPGMLRINNTTISGNTATGYGGGALLMGVELNHVTIADNQCRSSGFAYGTGGGISTYNVGNTYLRNTIVARNRCGTNLDDLAGAYTTGNSYNNLIGSPGTSGFTNGTNGNLVNVADPRLGPLANNGGLTQTHALLPGSPALDAGNDGFATGFSTDQRGTGFIRRADAADANTAQTVDIGAYEAAPMVRDIADQSIPANMTSRIDFYFGDPVVPPTFSVTSSNSTLVPNNKTNLNTVSGPASGVRTIVIAPAPGQFGNTTITVTVTGNGMSVSDTFQLSVLANPDLAVTKMHTGNFHPGQTGAAFTLIVRNDGAGAASGLVTLSDTLPDGLTATGISGTGWTCTLGTLTCTRSEGLAAGAAYPAVTLIVDVSETTSGSLTNTASVSNAGDTNSANNTASDTVVIEQLPDLVVEKSHEGSFRQGQNGASYSLTVSNIGTGATSGMVTLHDDLPAGLTAAEMSGTGWTCTLATLTCTRSDPLAAGASYPAVTLVVDVAAQAPANLTNLAAVTGGGETNTANNSAVDPTTVIQVADLTLMISHGGDFRQGQSGAVYILTASNTGLGTTTGMVTLNAVLPSGLAPVDMSGTGWTCTLGTLSCSRSDELGLGTSYPEVVLTVDVAANASPSVTVSGSITGGGELNTANNTASDPTTVIQAADLTVSKTHAGDFSQAQKGAVFTLTVSNAGPGATTGPVSLVDLLPVGLTATELTGTGWTCTLATLTCTRADPLASGGSYPVVTLRVDVAANALLLVTNTAQVSGGGELNTANNTGSDPVTVNPLPDLVLSKTHAGSLTQGQTGVQYTLRVGNSGHTATSGLVSVTDQLPAGLAATALSGEGWSCMLETLTCNRSDGLAAGGQFPEIILTVDVANDAPAELTNSATVSGGAELSMDNNTATDMTGVAQAADLIISKSHSGTFKQGQTGVTYRLTVTNSGGSPTSGIVTITDELPAGLTASGLEGEGWSCDLPSLTCTRTNPLAAGASYPVVTLTADVAADAPGSLTNQARVAGGGELVNTNNSASDLTTIHTRPVITLQPVSQSVWLGEPASLSAAASGDPVPTVQWQHSSDGDTWEDLPGETSATLSFTVAAEIDGRQFRAVFTNTVGSAVTEPAVITMNFKPVIDQQPSSRAVRSGSMVTFSVAVRARPNAEIHWQVSTDGGDSWTDIPESSTAALSFRAGWDLDGNQYRAVVSNSGGIVTSNAAVLVVDENRVYFPLVRAVGP